MAYDHQNIEQKWQKYWDEGHVFAAENPKKGNHPSLDASSGIAEDQKHTLRPKKYILDMFPYPSGAGLHVGHPKGYTATDIVSRYYHATGHNVLHTMGFDAFGLPAENYAIKTGTHPAITTAENITVFTEQLKGLGFSYDWDRVVDTTDPEYYRWTQWIFLELFKRGLAYEQDLPINYCPSCKTGLANEEVTALNTCDRCGTRVERRPIRQWVLKITDYADRLLSDIDGLDWPEGIKEMQRNWIGRSEGCEFKMMKDEGFIYSRASKEDFEKILEIREKTAPHAVHFTNEGFFVVKQGQNIAGFIRVNYFGEFTELGPLFIEEKYRGEKLGYKLISYVIEQIDASEFYIDCKKELAPYYEKLGFTYLDAPKDFQMEKLNKVWSFYREDFVQEDIREATAFMAIKKQDTPKIPSISVYTTRVDTVYGMTYAVLAPDHPQVQDFITSEKRTECEQYIERAKGQSDLDRTNEGREKTGVFTGSYVVNPYNGESVPLWIADYVLGSYGTGAVMAVPAHDERDFEFAMKYDLSMRRSIVQRGEIAGTYNEDTNIWEITPVQDMWDISMGKDGILIRLGEETSITSEEARRVFSEKAETEGFGQKKVNYKLRDWLFSRQRYWGEPIPLIHITHEDFDVLPRITDISEATDPSIAYIYDKKGTDKRCKNCTCEEGCTKLIIGGKTFSRVYDGITGKLIIDSRLPVTLPEVERYEPAGDGQSPLATVPDWVNVELASNLRGKRETNTMPQWGGSCWYYLRYMDPNNSGALASPEALNYWGMVDEYVGGAEHAVLHLLYARFWHKVLYDIGVVPHAEPFQKLTNVGMILAYAYERSDGSLVAVDMVEEQDGQYIEKETGTPVKQVVAKMSKSLKNVVNPNDIVAEYGADTLRLYEMSMSGFTDTAPWNPDAIIGVRRFLDKAYSTIVEGKNKAKDDMRAMKLLHKTVKKVGEDIVAYKFNTAISALQILLNEGIPTDPEFASEWSERFAIMLHPFAPHMAEELWNHLGQKESIYNAEWPSYDEWMLVDDEVTIAIQINGKLRGTYTGLNGVMQDEVSAYAHETADIAKWLEGKILVKEIFVPNKLLSIVVKDAE